VVSKGRAFTAYQHRWQCNGSASNNDAPGQQATTAEKSTATLPTNSVDGVEGVSMNEIELSLADGIVVRGQRWTHCQKQQQQQPGAGDGPNTNSNKIDNDIDTKTRKLSPKTTKILALHGWLDNCRSFHYLAPKLLEKFQQNNPGKSETEAVEIVAIDIPGHGLSSHKPLDGPTLVMSEGAYYIAEVIDALGWGAADADADADYDYDANDDGKVALIGHSMGGGMAITYAGVFPEQILRVVMIDMYGPEPGNPKDARKHIRSHVSQRRLSSMGGPKGRPHVLYPSLERAIERRQKGAKMMVRGTRSGDDDQYLSVEAATELVTRSMAPVYEQSNDDDDDDSSGGGGSIQGFKFQHDARMLWPTLQYMTVEQIQSIMEAVECPVCILDAKDGYPFAQDRIDRTIMALEPQIYKVLPGSHHLHADPDTADAVVDAVHEFFFGNGSDGGDDGQ
jgi:pimeloyl-ACP methyl ester carboxylesterase